MLTESHNFSNQHIGAIKNNRNCISEQYNVEIKITGKRFGQFQEVQITGFSKDIRQSLTALNLVAEQADNDFKEYKERVKRRRKSNKVFPTEHRPKVEKVKPKTNVNPFAMLQIDESESEREDESEDEREDEREDESEDEVATTRTPPVDIVVDNDSSSDSGEDFEEISDIKLCWADM